MILDEQGSAYMIDVSGWKSHAIADINTGEIFENTNDNSR